MHACDDRENEELSQPDLRLRMLPKDDRDDPDGDSTTDGGGPLFNLLRSKKYVTSKSQYVVFITPEIIESATAGTEDIRKKFRKRTR